MNLKVAQKTNEFWWRGMGSNENKAKRQTQGMDSDKRRYIQRGRDSSFDLLFSLSPSLISRNPKDLCN